MPIERSTLRHPADLGRSARTLALLLACAASSAIGTPAFATCAPEQHDFYGTCIEQLSLFGQASWKETARGAVLGHTLGWHASGLAIDRSVKPNRIYVADTSNNRILGFRSLGVCSAAALIECTNDSDCAPSAAGTCTISGAFSWPFRTRSVRQLFLFPTPLTSQVPSATIRVPMGAPGELQFDDDDNLVIRDHTWHRAWVVNLARDPTWVVPE